MTFTGLSLSQFSLKIELNKNRTAQTYSSVRQLILGNPGCQGHSTFIPLRCKSCKSGIGRIYRTTPLELDMIRDVFSLDCSSIKSYELGTQAGKNSYKTADELLDIPTAKDLKNEILKLQSVVVSLNERLQSVEKVIPETDGIGISTINNDNNTYSERQPPHSLNNKRAYTEMEKKGTVHQNIKHSKRIRT
ncbi:uncharacterized protein LOC5509886 isoform X4 [Nematostella vectensis]|uniref:uncharacterized protein LOC5509886 isoform X4 n=1 Tax=Nematostella vectensis TaxID=45351 RepID=UPI0020778AB7|nr:uncharacterized protein LOC5509886 isoform X4 [Nematostella vectensis]